MTSNGQMPPLPKVAPSWGHVFQCISQWGTLQIQTIIASDSQLECRDSYDIKYIINDDLKLQCLCDLEAAALDSHVATGPATSVLLLLP